jgi:hypothetical protein
MSVDALRLSPADRRRSSANNGNMQTPPSRKGGRPPAVERPPRASPRGSCLPQAVGSRGRKRATASPARARGKWRWRGRAWGRRPPCSIRSAQPDRRPAPRAVRRHIQLQPHAARRPPPRASSTSIDVEVDAAGSRPPSTRPTLHAAEIVLLDPPRLAPPQAWIPPAVDLEVAAGLGRSDADKWALAGCAWTLVGRGPRAPLLRRLPFHLLHRLPFHLLRRLPDLAGGGRGATGEVKSGRERGRWEVVGMQHPRGCATDWPCCILQQVLRLLLEPLQRGLQHPLETVL